MGSQNSTTLALNYKSDRLRNRAIEPASRSDGKDP